MAFVRVATMQRDEGDTLSAWIGHYGKLFGYKNLTILDNGSRDGKTINYLRMANSLGVRIIHDLNTHKDFRAKGDHMLSLIKYWDSQFDYDFAIPCDCDELLTVFNDDGLSCDSHEIHKYLDELKSERKSFRLKMSLFNVPHRKDWYAPNRSFHKSFVRSRSIESCDLGFHNLTSHLESGHISTRFTYLHNHHSEYDLWVSKLKNKIRDYVDVDDPEKLAHYIKHPNAFGVHAAYSLRVGREEYGSMYDNDLQIRFDMSQPNGTIDIRMPDGDIVAWNAAAYLNRNDDVRRAYQLGPLQHFLERGLIEKRPLS